jgi:hypothetical protein
LAPVNPPEFSLDLDAFGIPIEGLENEAVKINWDEWTSSIDLARRMFAWDRFMNLVQAHVLKQRKQDGKAEQRAEPPGKLSTDS